MARWGGMSVIDMAKDAVAKVEAVDLKVTRKLAAERHRPEVEKAGYWSEVADQPPLVALSSAVIVAGLAAQSAGVTRTGVRMLAAHALATGVKTALKRSIDRTRPDHALDNGYRMEAGDSGTHELSSFPSGHTAGAVAVAQAVARDAPPLAVPMRLFAVAVALIQVPRCKHYISDVIVGAAIGLAAERVASAALDATERRIRADS
jgi:membrane-associated phospholipid phosphatase